MKLVIILSLAAIAVAAAAPPPPVAKYGNDAEVVRYDNDNSGFGKYRFFFEQTDGTVHEQRGELRNEGREDEYLAISGYYSWIGPDGVTYKVTYTADENGYKPEIDEGPGGAVPPAVVASLLG